MFRMSCRRSDNAASTKGRVGAQRRTRCSVGVRESARLARTSLSPESRLHILPASSTQSRYLFVSGCALRLSSAIPSPYRLFFCTHSVLPWSRYLVRRLPNIAALSLFHSPCTLQVCNAHATIVHASLSLPFADVPPAILPSLVPP